MPIQDVTFRLAMFVDGADITRGRRILLQLLEALTEINHDYLIAFPDTPHLYDTNIIYNAEKGTETWQDIATTLRRGFGDCEDLAAYRCAELRAAGIAAKPYIRWRVSGPKKSQYHAVVKLPDGRIEDPSAALGMAGLPIVRRPVFVSPGPMRS